MLLHFNVYFVFFIGMTNTFTRFTFSDGFALSNSDSVKQLLSNVTYPKELHEFISVITQAHTFLDQVFIRQ